MGFLLLACVKVHDINAVLFNASDSWQSSSVLFFVGVCIFWFTNCCFVKSVTYFASCGQMKRETLVCSDCQNLHLIYFKRTVTR